MIEHPLHILLVEDEDAHAELVRRAFELRERPYPIVQTRSLNQARKHLRQHCNTTLLIITDWRLPDGEGLELLAERIVHDSIPVVIMTSYGNEKIAVDAMKAGALDYIVKSETTLLDIPHVAERTLREWQHIIERRRAEEALRRSEALYRLITEHTSDLIITLDQQWHFNYLSPSVQMVTGYSLQQILAKATITFIHPEDRAYVSENWELLKIEQPLPMTFRYHHANGTWRWMDIQVVQIKGEAEHAMVIVGRDITERRQLEAQLYQAQKMEAIGQLAGGIAHDFNNLLVVISGCADLASTALEASDPVQADLQEIQKAVRRATGLTRQLLTFARHQINEPQLLNLNDQIVDMNKLLHRLIREDITLTVHTDPQLLLIWADPGQIGQVIMNLVVNARDAMREGGCLLIETTNITLDHDYARVHPGITPGAYVLLTVTDTGIGMNEEVQRRAFEPFFSTKEQGYGTGLGLTTCYGIVRQHKGSIYLYSEMGQGTSVKVYLPCAADTAVRQSVRNEAHTLETGTESILLAEDELAVRQLTARILRTHGYTVFEAVNGAEAVTIAQQQRAKPINMLITDMIMPDTNGIELAAKVRSYLPNIPTLYMSGYTDHALVGPSLQQSDFTFLQKPFSVEALLHKVRQVLGQRR